jgi:flagellar basal body rod protein FlgB
MLRSLFGAGTLSSMLRGGLEETSATHRTIAGRVANALNVSTSADFASALEAQRGNQKLNEADLERDMASLADTQIRYEADAKLLQGAYSRLRDTLKMNG